MTAAHGRCLPVEEAPAPRQERGGSVVEPLTDAGFAAGWRLVRALPEPVARGAFRVGADVAIRRGGPGARRLRANLRRVVPDAAPAELDALVRAGLRSYARYWCEVFRLPTMDRADVMARMDPYAAGMAPLLDTLAQGRGVVAALPHREACTTWCRSTIAACSPLMIRKGSISLRLMRLRGCTIAGAAAAGGTDSGFGRDRWRD